MKEKLLALQHIEEYVLGVTEPNITQLIERLSLEDIEVRTALQEKQDQFNHYISGFGKDPNPNYLSNVLSEISLTKSISMVNGQLNQFVELESTRNPDFWTDLLSDLLMNPADVKGKMTNVVYEAQESKIILMQTNMSIQEAGHVNEKESILVISGYCKGAVQEQEVRLGPGDYWKVPQQQEHFLIVDPLAPVALLIQHQAA